MMRSAAAVILLSSAMFASTPDCSLTDITDVVSGNIATVLRLSGMRNPATESSRRKRRIASHRSRRVIAQCLYREALIETREGHSTSRVPRYNAFGGTQHERQGSKSEKDRKGQR